MLEITTKLPSEAWEKRLQAMSERMDCPGDYEEVIGRALSLAAGISWHLQEDGATLEICSPLHGRVVCETDYFLHGHGPGLTKEGMGAFIG